MRVNSANDSLSITITNQKSIPVTVKPPAIARCAGITPGLTTIGQFEKKYGHGFAYTGGHPHGAREWYDASTHTQIDVDAFNIGEYGMIVDQFTVQWINKPDKKEKIPTIHLRKKDFGVLASVHG